MEFVSNSSTASFVLLGTKLTKKEKKLLMEDNLETDEYEVFEDLGIDNPAETELYGKYITTHADDDGKYDEGSVSIQKLNNMVSDVAKKLKVPVERISLYYGVMAN